MTIRPELSVLQHVGWGGIQLCLSQNGQNKRVVKQVAKGVMRARSPGNSIEALNTTLRAKRGPTAAVLVVCVDRLKIKVQSVTLGLTVLKMVND